MLLADRPQNRSFGMRVRDLTSTRHRSEEMPKRIAYEASPKRCAMCALVLEWKRRKNKFCGAACSARFNTTGRIRSPEQRARISAGNTRYQAALGRHPRVKGPRWKSRSKRASGSPYPYSAVRSCAYCGVFHRDTVRKYCDGCTPNIRHYRSRAAFTFNVYEFPGEFDLRLIVDNGWYSPTGRSGRRSKPLNLEGVSRDHLYTIADGFNNRIDPALLAHPANCALVLHHQNNRKKARSSITLEVLKERIVSWNTKYAEGSA